MTSVLFENTLTALIVGASAVYLSAPLLRRLRRPRRTAASVTGSAPASACSTCRGCSKGR